MLAVTETVKVCFIKSLFTDCPGSVDVTSSTNGTHKEGDVLTCSADGYPPPKYEWTDSAGLVASTASTTTLTGGWFSLTCTATGNITTPCSASNSITGFVVGQYINNKRNTILVTIDVEVNAGVNVA